ncbi:MAG: helix-turn-helix transcriptional regulator [Dechloromonas sp.]|uniref:Helix-turn-helix transcriptional regulator n=1 Tax=Candidatus Dechloromonas phosphorivorans TaxID=2899244 RepID=A0A935K8G8_9RHOO|nr:helix-turn-helix transcriptional regulator [Candidatus Dechloromonas phosphorivorans]
MSQLATSFSALPNPIRWNWDFGVGLTDLESANLIALLDALKNHETLGRAAKSTNLSYRSAWGLLRTCESRFGKALVIKGRGKGTSLSDFGEQLLQLNHAACSTLNELHLPWATRLKEILSPSEVIPPEHLRIAASHDLALADWIENGRHLKVDIYWRGSEEALLALSRGECDACGFHLPGYWTSDQSETWLGRWLKPRQFAFFPVMRRQHGLLVAQGNPLSIETLADVVQLNLRMVNRQRGSGTRGMIDQLLAANGLQAKDVLGYGHEEFTHDAVAAAIASGQADVGFGIQAAAMRYDLGFIPLSRDLYCLAARSGIANSPAMRHLMRRFQGNTFHDRLRALPGYEISSMPDEFLGWDKFACMVRSSLDS